PLIYTWCVDKINRQAGWKELQCTLIDPVPTADGEPLARWDESKEQRSITTMPAEDLHRAIEKYDTTSKKLEQFVAATRIPRSDDESEWEVIDAEDIPDLAEQFSKSQAQYLDSIDKSQMERLIKELALKEVLEELSLPPEAIVRDPRCAENFLGYVISL